jgi:hypothetical protein
MAQKCRPILSGWPARNFHNAMFNGFVPACPGILRLRSQGAHEDF